MSRSQQCSGYRKCCLIIHQAYEYLIKHLSLGRLISLTGWNYGTRAEGSSFTHFESESVCEEKIIVILKCF